MGAQQRLEVHAKLNGVFKASLNGEVTWTNRIIIISYGVHPDTNNSGYWDISLPATGASIPVVGSAARLVSAAANANYGGILLNAWDALWYKLPLENGVASQPANFIIVPYTTVFDPDEHWICVVSRDDANNLKVCDGSIFATGEQSGPKDAALLHELRDQVTAPHFNGSQYVAPQISGALANAIAYGFAGSFREIGKGAQNNIVGNQYYDINPATLGTVVYNHLGVPSGRLWRAAVAADGISKFGDAQRNWNGFPSVWVDLLADESLYFNRNPQVSGVASGTWHVINYGDLGVFGQGFVAGINWTKIAHRQNVAPVVSVFGGAKIASGDFVSSDNSLTAMASRFRTAFDSPTQVTPTVAWTPQFHFTTTPGPNGNAPSGGMFVKWVTRIGYIGISHGFSSSMSSEGAGSGPQYVSLLMPAGGTAIPVLGTTSTRIVDPVMGIPLAEHEALYYVPPSYSLGTNSVDSGYVVGTFSSIASIPHNAIKIAQQMWENQIANTIETAMPFGGVNTAGQSPIGGRLWFLGDQYLAGGAGFGPIGNLGTIGVTTGWRAPLLGAAAGASGAGLTAIPYPAGWELGYKISSTRASRNLNAVGMFRFPSATNLVNGNVLAFLPGVFVPRNVMVTTSMNPTGTSGSANSIVPIEMRLVNATVGGVQGAQVMVGNVPAAGGSFALAATAHLNFRDFNGTSLD